MSFFASAVQERLCQAFAQNNITLDVRSDHIIAENSRDFTKERIQGIIESAGFCPLVSENKMDGNFVFTVAPCKIPSFFYESLSVNSEKGKSVSNQMNPISASNAVEVKEGHYFDKSGIWQLLKYKIFISTQEENVKDGLRDINFFRSLVSSALSKGVSEIILKHAKSTYPIVEVGSRIGYTLSEELSAKTIRTQPDLAECQLLSKSIYEPIYQTDIEGLFNCLLESGKKIPLFFALDVFDELSPSTRKKSLSQISQLQSGGDRLLIMLDTNPSLGTTIEYLESLYPEHAIFPYFSLTSDPAKFSVIIVPLKYTPRKPSQSELIQMIEKQTMMIMAGEVPLMQYQLHQLQEKFDLKVIDFEGFFVEQVKSELEQVGYTADVYYHASFTTGDLPEGASGIQQDLVYKPVTDTATVRQWCLTDDKLLNSLAQKQLSLPSHFNEDFCQTLREKGQKILGAEILVIDAKKQ